MGTRGSSPRRVIENIRKGYGIGSKKNVNRLVADNLHRSITHLSEELYSKDIHFILELIQNAEDNHYLPNRKPKLTFCLLPQDPTNSRDTNGAVLIINNEIGFQKENVEAISAIDHTTKDKREGYIGEKGIGFKSVFLVTRKPHIFSKGFQFYFHDQPDPEAGFGYIVPYWIQEVPKELVEYRGQTCILLPLKREKRPIVERELQQIAPETILFLNHLKAFQVSVLDNESVQVTRDDRHYPKVSISSGDDRSIYWISECEFPVPEELKEEKRDGITSRKVSVAFPLNSEKRPELTIYAFLPTSSSLVSGFDFLINADFILPASREQIQETREWNIWLRNCIPQTFFQGFEEMLQSQTERLQAYCFIPIQKVDRSPFFQPAVDTILSVLRDRAIIIAENDELIKPEQARFAPDQDFRKVFLEDPLPNQLVETPLVVEALEKEEIKTRLMQLGVTELSPGEIYNCLKDKSWVAQHSPEWFFSLYEYLKKHPLGDDYSLKGLDILVTDEGDVTNSNNPPRIYLPTKEANEFNKKNRKITQFLELQFLNKKLFAKIKENDPELESWLVQQTGLFTLDLSLISQELAIKLKEKNKELDASTLLWATRAIFENFSSLSENGVKVVKSCLPLLDQSGKICIPKEWNDSYQLIFPSSFDQHAGWQKIFGKDLSSHLVLSDDYLRGISKSQYSNYSEFLQEIGATKFPFPQKVTAKNFVIPNSPPPRLIEMFERPDRSSRARTFIDWLAPEWLQQPDEHHSTIFDKARALIKWLEYQIDRPGFKNHQYQPEDWRYCVLKGFYYSPTYQSVDSEFLYYLRNSRWLPTSKGLCKPGEAFLDKEEIKTVLGNSLPYSRIKISEKLATWLGVHTKATFDQVFELLQNHSHEKANKVDIRIINRIYKFLSLKEKNSWSDTEIQRFYADALILVRNPHPRWLRADQVIWPDRSEVFGNTFGYLEPEYEDLRAFFTNILGIRREMDEEVYAQAWLNLIETAGKQPAVRVESALEKIYPVLLRASKSPDRSSWWDTWVNQLKAWTQNDHFVSPEKVFIPDDGVMHKVLEEAGVEFAWRPRSDSFADYEPLYKAIGVRSLVNTTTVTSETELDISDVRNEDIYLTPSIKRAICWYLRNDTQTKDQFNTLKENGKLAQMLRTHECPVAHLRILFQLDSISAVLDEGATYWDRDNEKLYISAQHKQDDIKAEIPSSLARGLVNVQMVKDLEDFIGRLIGNSDYLITRILEGRSSWSLPKEEKDWIEEILGSISSLKDDTDEEEDSKTANEGEETGESGVDQDEGDGDTGNDNKAGNSQNGRNNGGGKSRDRDGSGGSQNGGRTQGQSGGNGHSSSTPENQRKFHSYIYTRHENDEEQKDIEALENWNEPINIAGMAIVMAYEKECKRHPIDMNKKERKNFPGYDIESKDATDTIIERIIEVKSTAGVWGHRGVALSQSQFNTAQEKKDLYWLYIVEKVNDENPRIIMIQNPAKNSEYFVFDDGWKDIASVEDRYNPKTDL